MKESSGAQWVGRFPTSTDVSELTPAFSGAVSGFIGALGEAGAAVNVNATYRPVERAYLMHYAWRIARTGLDPSTVPAHPGVEICWVHRDAEGNIDRAAAQAAAEAMVAGYDIVFQPALVSRHTQRQAIDMDISWTGTLEITNASGDTVSIATTPRSGMNTTLHAVGASYGVIKHLTDRPHWSTDGH
ncbi:peptidoglycan-binding domain-containing protein [Corallococcus sp. AB049A]|nr:peptidoglycan-binding domain-containing protein [Corallococcus sp. AB049A]